MRDYKKHLTLLPHKWQVVGIPLVCVLIVASTILFLSKDIYSDEKLLKLYETLSILTSVLLMICCLSKEKVEDEYITSVRYRALTISVVILFLASAFLGMINGNLRVLDFLTVRVSDTNAIRSEAFSSTAFICSYRVIGFFASISCMQIVYIILLKVLARIGSGNNYKSILLPYKCKKVGWWILPCSLVLIAVIIPNIIRGLDYSANNIWSTVKSYETALRLTVLLPYLAIILICLSKEKQEDEFIRQIRARIIAYFAIYYLIASFISGHARNAYEMSVMASGHVPEQYNEYVVIALVIFSILSWLPLVAVVYSLVLKKVLSNNIKESSNEE